MQGAIELDLEHPAYRKVVQSGNGMNVEEESRCGA